MTTTPHVLGVRCHFCSKFRPRWRVHQLSQAQTICDHCLEWHNAAMDMLAGGCPKGCQGCGASWEFLRAIDKSVEVRLYVVPRDGIYQLLCAACVEPYVRTRADLYRGTAYGHQALKK